MFAPMGRASGGRGVVVRLVVWLACWFVVFGVVCGCVFGASGPWWHVDVGARPRLLPTGPGVNEVQEIVTMQGEDFGFAEQTDFVLKFDEQKLGPLPTGEFGTKVLVEAFPTEVTLLSAESLQTALEEGKAYGPGNVTVTESSKTANGEPLPFGEKRYLVTSVGSKAGEKVAQVEVADVSGSTARTGVLTPGRSAAQLVVSAVNRGDGSVEGGVLPVTLTDRVPAGLRVAGVQEIENNQSAGECSLQEAGGRQTAVCTFTNSLPPFDLIELRVDVDADGVVSGEVNEASVTGGGAMEASAKAPITVGDQPTPFGVERFEQALEEEGGGVDTQAGSHPFQVTTSFTMNQTFNSEGEGAAAGLAKDILIRLPAGMIGDPILIPRCTLEQFQDILASFPLANECSPGSAVGAALITINEPGQLLGEGAYTFTAPVFNLEPERGEPARFGFLLPGTPVFIDVAVRSGEDYGLTVQGNDISETAGLLRAEFAIWGVPDSSAHNQSRGNGCLQHSGACSPLEEGHPPAFLSLPTSCSGTLASKLTTDPWTAPGSFSEPVIASMRALDGCNRLPFSPSLKVTPDGQAGATPTGLTVDEHVPQEESLSANGLAEADVRDVTVTLPEGVSINPAGAVGLEACSQGQVGVSGEKEGVLQFTPTLGSGFCPEASKVGTVKITTPVLANPLEGAVYLAQQDENPFGSLLAMYIVAQDPVSGVVIKLAGQVALSSSGQITATFDNTPEAPFEDAEEHFFGGARAPLSTPAHCGSYTANATISSWSGQTPSSVSAPPFQVTSGPNGGGCPSAPLPFEPTITGGSTNIQAGALSPFTMTITRQDANQAIQTISLHMPPGLAGLLSTVALCPEPQATQGTCGPESQIGETTVSAGVGSEPITVTGGRVYITGPYEGAPYGLSIVNPVKAGPFDLENTKTNHPPCDCIVIRARIEVNPVTAQLTVTSDQIPTIIEGIPLQLKHINVLINRPGFTFNPTNCQPKALAATVTGNENTSQLTSTPFQVTNCAALNFQPKFTVTTSGKTSKADGASLHVLLSYPDTPPGTSTNIAKVKVDLPKQLPSRLTTLQKACLAAVFETNPANCPPASIIGHAKVTTQVLPVPLEGPAYFVSHGNEAFPSLTIVLQGYGTTIILTGSTLIRHGITSTTFHNTPDVPFHTFELTLPQGKYSALAATTNLCKTKLNMPTALVAQNGVEIHQTTKITTTNCPKPKPKHKK